MADGPRIAYVITSYKLPQQVLRLARALRKGSRDGRIIVHHDDRRVSLDRPSLEALDVQFVEPPSKVTWGEFSQLAMVLRCLEWAEANTDFDWLVLISGQDYPVRPVPVIEQSLGGADVDAFIGTGRCDRPPLRRSVDEFGFRYYYRWGRLRRSVPAAVGRLAGKGLPLVGSREMTSGMWVGVRAFRTPFGPRFACHCGRDWFTLSRKAVASVSRFIRARPDVLNFYRRTLIPTESFVHTVLANDRSLRLSGDTRRYLVFDERHRAQPRILRTKELDTVLASGADFARKFDETVDSRVLDEIDRRVHPG